MGTGFSMLVIETQLKKIVNEQVDNFIDTLVEDTKDILKADMNIGFAEPNGIVSPNYAMIKNNLKSELHSHLMKTMKYS